MNLKQNTMDNNKEFPTELNIKSLNEYFLSLFTEEEIKKMEADYNKYLKEREETPTHNED